jgi:hypothetical protein
VRHFPKHRPQLTDAEIKALLDGTGRAESDTRDHAAVGKLKAVHVATHPTAKLTARPVEPEAGFSDGATRA